ncbi:MAG: ABC transporter ATP-binding protein [Anaerolineaceae bacterium]|nr:ABC transporter ATP-binding protein [Anaerolineaceae bacterium]
MSHPIIETFGLWKVYGANPGTQALKEINLSIQEKEMVAITGSSGSGKTTLLNLMGTLDKPTIGYVCINEIDIRSLKGDTLADFRREKIGFIFQLFQLIPTLTAFENVMLPLVPYQRRLNFKLKDRARELLASVGLEHRMQHLPGQLSGGEQQRVAIARALVNSPGIILADEPTGNLDSRAGEEIMALLEQLVREKGLTLVLVTHNVALTTRAARVIHLQDGRVVETVR